MYGMNPYTAYPFMGAQMGQSAPFMPGGVSTPNGQQTPQSASPVVLQVASAKDFDSVTIQPGRPAIIVAQNDPFIAFKNADAMGLVQTALYRIEPVTADQISGPSVEYATKNELAQVQQMVQQLVDSLSPTVKKTAAWKEAPAE